MLTTMFKEKRLLPGIYLGGQSLSDFASCFYEFLLCFTVFFCASIPIMTSLHPSKSLFGWSAFVHVHGPHQGELDSQALKCFFIGYVSDKKGYKYYHPDSR